MASKSSASTCSCKTSVASKKRQNAKSKSTLRTAINKTKIVVKPDLLDCFHGEKICDIPATGPQKPDPMDLFRPPSRTVLDYKLSQMDTKLEREVKDGVQKFHIRETKGVYLPYPPGVSPPPKKESSLKGIVLASGGPPCWKFLDEILAVKIEKLQENFTNRLPNIIKQREAEIGKAMTGEHVTLIQRAGPEWFQELSPQQLRAIDNLKNSILRDTKMKTICNTQDSLAELGLLLRPNHIHVKRALTQCCQCPVEFLLILYQLMDKNRTAYSVNDRIVLSAVVHLTMRETLKELHIRIPSPPPPERIKKPKPRRPKPIKYASPYLVPFTFVPEPRKHHGVYKNRHVQHPESPYFSYKSELLPIEYCNLDLEPQKGEERPVIRVTPKQEGITDVVEGELVNELKLAQFRYNALANCPYVALLHKPSIYIPCDYGIDSFSVTTTTTQTTALGGKGRLKKAESKDPNGNGNGKGKGNGNGNGNGNGDENENENENENKTNLSITVAVKVTTDYDEHSRPIRSVCKCDLNIDETANSKSKYVCTQDDSNNYSEPCGTPSGNTLKSVYVCTPNDDSDSVDSNDCCGCGSSKTMNIQTDDCIDEVPKRKGQVIGDEKDCAFGCLCDQYHQCEDKEKLIVVGKRYSDECKCKAENEKILAINFCQCDKCKADREEKEKRKKQTFVIAGMRASPPPLDDEEEEGEEEAEEGETVRIIDSTRQKKICTCLEDYYEKVKKYEEMKKRFDAQRDLLTLEQQYIIGGVTTSPEGDPVYMLSGTIPEHECPCAKHYEDRLREEQRVTNMPKDLPSLPKYVIGGVTPGPDGNVYIIQGSKVPEDCSCMRTYNAYIKKHSVCLQAYEEYKKKIEQDIQAYMEELEADERYKCPKAIDVQTDGDEEEEEEEEEDDDDTVSADCILACCKKNKFKKSVDCSGGTQGTSTDDQCILKCCQDDRKSSKKSIQEDECALSCCNQQSENIEVETCLKIRLELNMNDDEKDEDVCGCEDAHSICFAGGGVDSGVGCGAGSVFGGGAGSVVGGGAGSVVGGGGGNVVGGGAGSVVGGGASSVVGGGASSVVGGGTGSVVGGGASSVVGGGASSVGGGTGSGAGNGVSGGGGVSTGGVVSSVGGEEAVSVGAGSAKPKPKPKPPKGNLVRFVIMEKIPCDSSEQETIIKNALEILAKDGFPLAKLPDCHRLPHFKLWMQMRCHMFWTQWDRIKMMRASLASWKHTDYCSRKVLLPKFDRVLLRHKFTWRDAVLVRKLAGDLDTMYYRQIRQARIDEGREFFPSTYSYELPTWNFRDAFFAYTPSKEEDCITWRPWYQFEIKKR